ncbi:MAG: hypothetical protein H0X51_09335 [Parachlamydiaceae bacterium]|nr:hypothetical protein [Parachlamydiaceae bacterium]
MFNALFLTIGAFEFCLLLFFFTFLMQSAILAFTLAVLFLTFFSYFILRMYFQTRKPEQFEELKDLYVSACKTHIQYDTKTPEHHLELAHACAKLAGSLQNREANLYQPPEWLKWLTPYLGRISSWCHWYDVHHMQEILHQEAIKEHINLVKREPTSMAVHAALANAYIMLSGLYSEPHQDEEHAAPAARYAPMLQQKFRQTAERAIEEFKILNSFAPDDPWVHAQLAYSYRDLKMPLEEIRAYEILLKLNPDDKDTLFKLGTRYFQQGMNAQGLKIYEQLRRFDSKRANDLISFYGAVSTIQASGNG